MAHGRIRQAYITAASSNAGATKALFRASTRCPLAELERPRDRGIHGPIPTGLQLWCWGCKMRIPGIHRRLGGTRRAKDTYADQWCARLEFVLERPPNGVNEAAKTGTRTVLQVVRANRKNYFEFTRNQSSNTSTEPWKLRAHGSVGFGLIQPPSSAPSITGEPSPGRTLTGAH